MTRKNKKITYKSSGVDVDKGNSFINKISPIVGETSRSGADSKLGGFGSIFDLSKFTFNALALLSQIFAKWLFPTPSSPNNTTLFDAHLGQLYR